MFDTIFDLPVHALVVHAAVVLAPLLALLSIVFALVPRARGRLDWAVALLSVVVPATVFAARMSGEPLKEKLYQGQTPPSIATHESFALPLLLTALVTGLVSLLMVWYARRESRTLTMVFGALSVIGSLVLLYFVFRAGDSGARAVWGS